MKERLAILVFGAAFGFLLGWARLNDPDVILAMLRLQEFDVFLIMGSAIATASIGTRLLRARGARARIGGAPVTWRTLTPTRDHVVGSMLFGLGWSVSCTCPGPIAVQLGNGQVSAVFTAAGFLAGIALRDATKSKATAPSQAPASAAAAGASPGL